MKERISILASVALLISSAAGAEVCGTIRKANVCAAEANCAKLFFTPEQARPDGQPYSLATSSDAVHERLLANANGKQRVCVEGGEDAQDPDLFSVSRITFPKIEL